MIDNIVNSVNNLIDKYDERNPFKLCKLLDIELIHFNFNKNFKGYQIEIGGVKMIVVNANLSTIIKKFICAHELAHFVLHDDLSDNSISKFNVSDITAKPELHANYFASELLLSDDDVINELQYYDNYYDIASNLNIIPEILDFKIRVMKYKGYDIPYFLNVNGDFLAKYIDHIYDNY